MICFTNQIKKLSRVELTILKNYSENCLPILIESLYHITNLRLHETLWIMFYLKNFIFFLFIFCQVSLLEYELTFLVLLFRLKSFYLNRCLKKLLTYDQPIMNLHSMQYTSTTMCFPVLISFSLWGPVNMFTHFLNRYACPVLPRNCFDTKSEWRHRCVSQFLQL